MPAPVLGFPIHRPKAVNTPQIPREATLSPSPCPGDLWPQRLLKEKYEELLQSFLTKPREWQGKHVEMAQGEEMQQGEGTPN